VHRGYWFSPLSHRDRYASTPPCSFIYCIVFYSKSLFSSHGCVTCYMSRVLDGLLRVMVSNHQSHALCIHHLPLVVSHTLLCLSVCLCVLCPMKNSPMIVFFSVLAKRFAGKNVFKMTCFVLNGTLNLNSVNQSLPGHCLRDPMFSHFDTIPACDRPTLRHTQTWTHNDSIYCAGIASHGKNETMLAQITAKYIGESTSST